MIMRNVKSEGPLKATENQDDEQYMDGVVRSLVDILDKCAPLDYLKTAADIAEILMAIHKQPAPDLKLSDAFQKLPWLSEFAAQVWPYVGALEAFMQSRFRYMVACFGTLNEAAGHSNSGVLDTFVSFLDKFDEDFLPFDPLQEVDAKAQHKCEEHLYDWTRKLCMIV